ncbi:MAG: dihydrofolate reductase [Caulobacterales bacterium]
MGRSIERECDQVTQAFGTTGPDSSIPIAIVVARAANNVIGRDNNLPWRLKADLARFKAITMGKPVIMGRKTWESLPKKPLPGRTNIILSESRTLLAPDAWVFPSFAAGWAAGQAIAARDNAAEVCVIGGQGVFAEALPLASRLYLTEVDCRPEGDAFLPAFDEAQWIEKSREAFPAGPNDEFAAVLRVLERRA